MGSSHKLRRWTGSWMLSGPMSMESTGFLAQQALLEKRLSSEELDHVFLDPDGTNDAWLGVVIEQPTRVIYEQQCAGTSNEARFVEGFYIPMGGLKANYDEGKIEPAKLTDLFHRGRGCAYGWAERLPQERLEKLQATIRQLPYRFAPSISSDTLELDMDRVEQVCEAWVPVKTPAGPGILLWQNCD